MYSKSAHIYKLMAVAIGIHWASTAQAHHVMEGGGFANGATFPIHGLDHILAMIAVGLWASLQEQRRRCWAIFGGFASALILGGVWGAIGAGNPWMEEGVPLSVAAIGLVMAFALRGPTWLMTVVAAAFAISHGYVGGAEMPASNGLAVFLVGFLLCTALLQAGGYGVGVLLSRYEGYPIRRWAGGLVAVFGLMLAVG